MSWNNTNKHLIHVEGVDQSTTVEKQGSTEMITKNFHELINEVNNFYQSTSLHGYAYISNSSSLILKIIWGVIISVMTCLGLQFLAMNTDEYLKSRITTSIESTTTSLEVKKVVLVLTDIILNYFLFAISERCISINKCLQQKSN